MTINPICSSTNFSPFQRRNLTHDDFPVPG